MEAVLKLHVLASGSKGNATIVEAPRGSVLIDCGLSLRELQHRAEELGISLDDIRAVFLTHEHSDHTSGLSAFARHYAVQLFSTQKTAQSKNFLRELPFISVNAHDTLELCGVRVQLFSSSHDVVDPFGLSFSLYSHETLIDKIGYCTDTGILTKGALEHLYGSRILALEANHDERMLREGPYPEFLKTRVAGSQGHLSNRQSAQGLLELVTPATEQVVAMHLSEKNNLPSLCVKTLADALGAQATNDTFTKARTPDGKLTIQCAAQNKPLTFC